MSVMRVMSIQGYYKGDQLREYLFPCETLYSCIPVYTCSSFEPIVRKGYLELIWITRRLTSLYIRMRSDTVSKF